MNFGMWADTMRRVGIKEGALKKGDLKDDGSINKAEKQIRAHRKESPRTQGARNYGDLGIKREF